MPCLDDSAELRHAPATRAWPLESGRWGSCPMTRFKRRIGPAVHWDQARFDGYRSFCVPVDPRREVAAAPIARTPPAITPGGSLSCWPGRRSSPCRPGADCVESQNPRRRLLMRSRFLPARWREEVVARGAPEAGAEVRSCRNLACLAVPRRSMVSGVGGLRIFC